MNFSSGMNMDGSDGLPKELADAVRKSWSESQEIADKFRHNPAVHSGDSPIGTPTTLSLANMSSLGVPEAVTPLEHDQEDIAIENGPAMNLSNKTNNGKETTNINGNNNANMGNTSNIRVSVTDQNNEYQLFKHHYSMSNDNRESVSEILNDLDLGAASTTTPTPPPPSQLHSTQEPSSIHTDFNNSNISTNIHEKAYFRGRSSQSQQLRNPFSDSTEPRKANHQTMRRSSIQDVQWIRQLLNPRSSFSGISSREPDIVYVKAQQQEQGSLMTINKCWVTTLLDDSAASVKSMIVLYHSLLLTDSKYPLFVLHDEQLDVSQLQKYNIHTLPISQEYFQNNLNLNSNTNFNNDFNAKTINILQEKKWFILSLFVSFINSNYDLICYISPTCMITDNIDELLDNPTISDEVDNETCVLLTNVIINKELPQLIVLKPNEEVGMCIKEYFTTYGDEKEKLEKISKLLQMNDYDILSELFGDTWGEISSDGYVTILEKGDALTNFDNYISKKFSKILDYKKIKPWNMKTSDLTSSNANNSNEDATVAYKWYQVWLEFWNSNQITST